MALEPTLRSYLGPILHPAKVTGNPWLLLWPMHRIEGRDGPFLRQTRGHPDTGLGRPCLLHVLICKRVAPVQLYLIVKWCVAQSWCCTAALGAPVTFLAHLAFAWFVDLAQTPCVSCVAGRAGGRSSRSFRGVQDRASAPCLDATSATVPPPPAPVCTGETDPYECWYT